MKVGKCLILVFLLIFFTFSSELASSGLPKEYSRMNNNLFSSLIEHEPIIITSASDPDLVEFPGSGSINDPYIIEGYRIETDGAYGILIDSVLRSFIIRNCYVDAINYGIERLKFKGFRIEG